MAALLNWMRGGGGAAGGGGRRSLGDLRRKLFNRPTSASSSSSSPPPELVPPVVGSSNLFVGGLCYDTNETALRDAFSEYGDVTAVKVICHPTTGKSKGFGFVRFSSQHQAAEALHKMNGQVLDGRNIRVHYASSGQSPARRPPPASTG
ncbi:hypothetical protein U9M48_016337 [Paspalum notatum var. saurae]|uniref:RRM domain-containing protein n=1 Tax=Paspalum notatum var. saurae TaxID=547442 RepID=A0AAQ3T589_PASNO